MIDDVSRHKAAELLQQFLRKEKTGTEVFDQWPQSDDPALAEIGYHLTVDGIAEEGAFSESRRAAMLATIGNCIRFLESDLPYEWPRDRAAGRMFLRGCLLYPLVVLLPAAAIGWLVAMILPIPLPAGVFVGVAIGVAYAFLMDLCILPALRAWRIPRELTRDQRSWPFRDSAGRQS